MKHKSKYKFPSTHTIKLLEDERQIKLFNSFDNFKSHMIKHVFTQSLWEDLLGSEFKKYSEAYKRDGFLSNTLLEDLYFELIYPKLCDEIDSCLKEPLFVKYFRQKHKNRIDLAKAKRYPSMTCISSFGLTLSFEFDILKTAFFFMDTQKISSENLRIIAFRDKTTTIKENRIFRNSTNSGLQYILVTKVKWVLSDFWKQLSKRVQGK